MAEDDVTMVDGVEQVQETGEASHDPSRVFVQEAKHSNGEQLECEPMHELCDDENQHRKDVNQSIEIQLLPIHWQENYYQIFRDPCWKGTHHRDICLSIGRI